MKFSCHAFRILLALVLRKRLEIPTLDRVRQQCVNIVHGFGQW